MSEESSLHLQFNLKNVARVLEDVDYSKLPILAVQLGLERVRSEIEDESVPEQRRLCLVRKLLTGNPNANWEVLCNALCHPEIAENVLARSIEERYLRRGSTGSSISSSRSTPSSPGPLSPLYATRDIRTKEKVARKLRTETERDVMESFARLESLFTLKLSTQELDAQLFCSYLTTLFQQQSVRVTLPDTGDLKTIIDSISVQKLWDYYNYGDIERITRSYLPNDQDMESAIDYHREMVNNYLATKCIADYIEERLKPEFRTLTKSFHGRRNSKSYYAKLSMTLHDVNIGQKTLKYVRDLWKKLKSEFHLPDCDALLDDIYKGSVVIVWSIPSSVSPTLKSPQPWSAIHFLQMMFVCRMVLNDTSCIYDEEDSKKLLGFCSEGNFEEVSWLLKSEKDGAAVNATYAEMLDGKSGLILASEAGHELVMFNLLDYGAELDFKHEVTGRTALFFAAENRQDVAISILLAYGADPDLKDLNGETAYSIAKNKLGNDRVCEELRQIESKKQVAVRSTTTSQKIAESLEGARVAMLRPFYQAYQQWTSDLIGAARNDNLESVQYILEHQKGDINTRESDEYGWTPLMWATENGNFAMVELLLKRGADPKFESLNQWTPLILAGRKGRLKIAKALLDKRADSINARNDEGVSALAMAIYEHHTAVAMLLIHRGADVHLPDQNGWTPLMRASNEGNLKLIKTISNLGAHLDDQTEEGFTPLMIASLSGHTEAVKELARREADLDLAMDAGDTALHIAALRDHPDVAKELASHKANLDKTNMNGLTALMIAANKGYLGVADELLKGGADVNFQHKETGWTAIFFAAKNDRVEILQHLLLHGAKSELADGTTLTDVAGHLKQMQILDVLGTSVDRGEAPLRKDTGYLDITNSLDALVCSLEEKIRGLYKKYQHQ